MIAPSVSVAVPVRNGGARLGEVLDAVRSQVGVGDVELLVADSASSDGSAELARAAGARVIAIAPGAYGHGRTRNLLAEQARTPHVAFLTQDAVPAGARWLAELVGAFELAPDVALAFGPYRAQPGASPMVRADLERWFGGLSPDGRPRIDRLEPAERSVPAARLLGARAYFTDANGCVRRTAWEQVPFPEVPYAEDHALAIAMLRAGFAKAYVPTAAVEHSHDYGAVDLVRRAFDEARGLREVYGWGPALRADLLRTQLIERARADVRWSREHPDAGRGAVATGAAAMVHHGLRLVGTVLGSRADRLPPRARRALSLERRAGFEPLDPLPS